MIQMLSSQFLKVILRRSLLGATTAISVIEQKTEAKKRVPLISQIEEVLVARHYSYLADEGREARVNNEGMVYLRELGTTKGARVIKKLKIWVTKRNRGKKGKQ